MNFDLFMAKIQLQTGYKFFSILHLFSLVIALHLNFLFMSWDYSINSKQKFPTFRSLTK